MTNTEALEMIARGVTALRESSQQGNVDALGDLLEAAAMVTVSTDIAACELHYTWLMPWTTVGRQLGVSKQAVQQKYGTVRATEEF